jgi:tRNA(Arg) A34 adenosine deaminase TadA
LLSKPVKKESKPLIWHRLSSPWQTCVEEAWTAYCRGSLPIGSVITHPHGKILARGRNRIYEQNAEGNLLCGHRLAHAEMNTLIQVAWHEIDARTCVLYTTTEPCPLCVGAVRMTRVGEVRYASRDGAAGSADLFEANPFLRRGKIKVVGPENPALETILVAMLIEFALAKADENTPSWYERLAAIVPTGAQLGRELMTSKQLREWSSTGRTTAFVVDQLAKWVG